MTTSQSGTRTAGAVALAVGGLIDIVNAVLALAGPTDDAPPTAVLILLAVAGLVSTAGLVRGRRGLVAAYVARVVSAGLGIPAFFLDAPVHVVVLVTIGLALSVIGIWLTLPARRRSVAAPSRSA